MDIDFSPITASTAYKRDRQKLKTTGSQRARTIYFYIFLAFTIIGWPYLIHKGLRYVRSSSESMAERDKALAAFASANNFQYKNHVTHMQELTGNQCIRDLDLPFATEYVIHMNDVQGKLFGYKFSYTLSSIAVKNGDKSSQYPSIIFTIDLPVTLPRMFINSKFNNLRGIDAKPINFKTAEDHTLEGDFPNYYTVRIEKNEQIDMYTTLTPEVMEALIENNQYDVWLNGRQLILTTFGDQARYFAGTPVVFGSALGLMKEIDKVARTIR